MILAYIRYPPVVDDEDLETLEKFVVMMYDRSSTAEGVDAARLDMFAWKQRPYEAIPPTQGALKQHVKRAAYQAGCIWSQATVLQPKCRLLPTGAGQRQKICGTSSGQSSHPLQKVASS